MTFFNKKTEVMKVELTPLGRYKLSVGRLKPSHYRFFDNNVVYDSTAIGTTEEQNDADQRIREETPVLKQNPNISGVETMIQIIETEGITVQTTILDVTKPNMYSLNLRKNKRDDHINQLVNNLGTIEPDSNQSPAFQVNAFRGELRGSTTKFYASSNIQTSSIPQIELELTYELRATNAPLDPNSSNYDIQSIGPFDDGSRLLVKKQDPLIRVKESNAFDEKENFHLTAFRVFKQDGVGKLVYEKMNFDLKQKRIMSDLYVGEKTIEKDEYTPNDVSYYFDILVDKEIAESDYCDTIGDLPIRNIYLDEEIICPDQQEDLVFDIYQTDVTSEDLEDCD